MRRVIQRQITTIKIVSIKLTWADEAAPVELDPMGEEAPSQEGEPKAQAALPRNQLSGPAKRCDSSNKKIHPKIKSKPAGTP